MKRIILFFGLLISFATASAQGSLEVGATQLNAGFGFSGWGIPVYVGLDYGIREDITIGGEISYRRDTQNYVGGKVKYSGLGVGANANYHFNRLLNIDPEFDLYAGATLTYFSWQNNISGSAVGSGYNYAYDSGLGFVLQTGGRYFFSDDFGVNLELGGGSFFGGKLGITYKF